MRSNWFSRPKISSPAVYFVTGPDKQDHSLGCDFYVHDGVLPCSCDATRHPRSAWWDYWLVWAKHRARSADATKWPVWGPDETPWIPGVDFDDSDDKESI